MRFRIEWFSRPEFLGGLFLPYYLNDQLALGVMFDSTFVLWVDAVLPGGGSRPHTVCCFLFALLVLGYGRSILCGANHTTVAN